MENSRSAGPPRERREDPELITGKAKYAADFTDPDMAHAAVLRGRYGHATIERIDASAATAHDGVLDVITARDLGESSIADSIRVPSPLPDREDTELPLLAGEAVRYLGEPIAVVIAEDSYTAHDAVDMIDVWYDRREAVTDRRRALDDDAPVVNDEVPDNLVREWEFGDEAVVERAFENADCTARVELEQPRLIPNPMEPRTAVAEYDQDTETLTVRNSTQMPHRDRDRIADVLGVPEERVTVIAPAVGGGFGTKGTPPYPEVPLVAWSAKRLCRPVKWIGTRTESHLADHHGRDVNVEGRLALDEDGTMLGLAVRGRVTIGAYPIRDPSLSFKHVLLTGPYEIPAVHGSFAGVVTNAAPVGPYRGAGRPEVIYPVERLVNQAATEIGMDPAELRRRNFVPPDAFPYETPAGAVYDSGDYEPALDRALDAIDYDEFRNRQANRRNEDRYLGIGFASFVENTGSSRPHTARIEFNADGTVTAFCGTADHGQGHETTFAQVVADQLGVPYDDVEIVEGNTDDLPRGGGTAGSASTPLETSALVECAREVREEARSVAANHLEASRDDVRFEDGVYYISGAPEQSISIQEIAKITVEEVDVSSNLEATNDYEIDGYTYSFGTHVATVEVFPESGELSIERYVAIDDCGTQVNPRLVEGQLHGGIVQGIGQALYEEAVYDDTGNLLTGSFQDYALPNAEHVPELEVDSTVTPSPWTSIGAKGVGEAGTIAAPPAIVNAVIDALRPLGVDHIDMPVTPEKVWRACQEHR